MKHVAVSPRQQSDFKNNNYPDGPNWFWVIVLVVMILFLVVIIVLSVLGVIRQPKM